MHGGARKENPPGQVQALEEAHGQRVPDEDLSFHVCAGGEYAIFPTAGARPEIVIDRQTVRSSAVEALKSHLHHFAGSGFSAFYHNEVYLIRSRKMIQCLKIWNAVRSGISMHPRDKLIQLFTDTGSRIKLTPRN